MCVVVTWPSGRWLWRDYRPVTTAWFSAYGYVMSCCVWLLSGILPGVTVVFCVRFQEGSRADVLLSYLLLGMVGRIGHENTIKTWEQRVGRLQSTKARDLPLKPAAEYVLRELYKTLINLLSIVSIPFPFFISCYLFCIHSYSLAISSFFPIHSPSLIYTTIATPLFITHLLQFIPIHLRFLCSFLFILLSHCNTSIPSPD